MMFGLYQLGRSSASADDVDGPCVNNLPFGIPHAQETDTLGLLHNIRTTLSERVAFEQSSPDTAISAAGLDSKCLPYNAHLNVLWQKMSLAGSSYAEQDLFVPYVFGQQTDFSSKEPIDGRTAVDALAVSKIPQHNVFVDIEPGETGVLIGIMANEALMDRSAIEKFVGALEESIFECVEELSNTPISAQK